MKIIPYICDVIIITRTLIKNISTNEKLNNFAIRVENMIKLLVLLIAWFPLQIHGSLNLFCDISLTHLFCNPVIGKRIQTYSMKKMTKEEQDLILFELNRIRSSISLRTIYYGKDRSSSFLSSIQNNMSTNMLKLVRVFNLTFNLLLKKQ